MSEILEKKKKKILSMCVHKENFQFAPKYLILAPSFQKSYKLAHEIQSICSILSLLPSFLKNNYNNLWIITNNNNNKAQIWSKETQLPQK